MPRSIPARPALSWPACRITSRRITPQTRRSQVLKTIPAAVSKPDFMLDRRNPDLDNLAALLKTASPATFRYQPVAKPGEAHNSLIAVATSAALLFNKTL